MKISIIGGGNVATHLCVALADKAEEVIIVSSRTLEDLPMDSDLYIISVSDDAIAEVAGRLPAISGVVCHTSGSVSMEVLKPFFEHYGVLYPLQTFTKWVDVDYSKVPVFVEGVDHITLALLKSVASLFARNVYTADSAKRKRLHIASVFACNYANHLWTIADKLLQADGYGIEVLMPLIDATVEKLHHLPPAEAQTGPAVRGDRNVIQAHEEMIEDQRLRQIYSLMAESIIHEKNK